MDIKELLRLATRLHRESVELGIPAISVEDGLVLMALAFEISSSRGVVRAVDAAGVGFSALWIIAGLPLHVLTAASYPRLRPTLPGLGGLRVI